MKKATNKLMSFLAAFAMVLSVLVAPFTSANAAEAKYENSTNKINIHKILLDDTNNAYTDWIPEDHKTDGGIQNVKEFFGSDAKEIAGVAYDIYVEEKATKENQSNSAALNTEFNTTEFQANKYYRIVNNEAITEENGTGEIELEDGSYVIVENASRTTYQDPKTGQTVSRQGKAIPVRITLPAALPKSNTTGVLHLYPKNTTVDSPDVEKNFTDKIKIEDANNQTAQDAKEDEANYRVEGVGREVPYTVETVFKPNTTFEHAYWNDQMTKGLTFSQAHLDAMRVYVNGVDQTSKFTKTPDGNGFKLVLNDMTLVNNKEANTTVRIEYTATMNEDSIVDIPESNDVTFHYGNNPSEGNTPKPQTPSEGKITVTKTWNIGDNAKPDTLLVQLYNANTGAKVGDPVDLAKQEDWAYTWTELNADYQYKVVEVSKDYEVVYGLGEAGVITLKNNVNDNPTPKNPKEPKVVRYGKKFVKVDELTDKRLENAEFVVTDNKGNYLVKKSADEVANEKAAYTNAVNAYDAVYKNPTATQTQLDNLYSEVETAAETLNNPYKWEKATDKAAAKALDNVVTLNSDANGKFEITDLQAGDYYLEETVAPRDYAVREDKVKFTVGKGTYAEDKVKPIDYEANSGKEDALRVDNRSLTIPQTGGIGSLIFIVAGLALMGVAFVAMKRKNSYEEA